MTVGLGNYLLGVLLVEESRQNVTQEELDECIRELERENALLRRWVAAELAHSPPPPFLTNDVMVLMAAHLGKALLWCLTSTSMMQR